MRPLLVLVTIVVLAAPAAHAAEPSEAPQRCLQLSTLKSTEALGNQKILFETQGSHHFLNTLPHPCPGLRRHSTLLLRTSMDEICDVDVVTVLETFGWGAQPGASCGLGRFEPLDADEVKQLEVAARAE